MLLIIIKYVDKKTIVFDLDETLIRTQREEFADGFDSRVAVIDQHKEEFEQGPN